MTSINKNRIHFGATVGCEPWFTGSREICELGKNVNHKKITKKKFRTGELNYVNQAYS